MIQGTALALPPPTVPRGFCSARHACMHACVRADCTPRPCVCVRVVDARVCMQGGRGGGLRGAERREGETSDWSRRFPLSAQALQQQPATLRLPSLLPPFPSSSPPSPARALPAPSSTSALAGRVPLALSSSSLPLALRQPPNTCPLAPPPHPSRCPPRPCAAPSPPLPFSSLPLDRC